MSKEKNDENGLEVEIRWKSVVSLGDLIKICEFLGNNPCGFVFEIEIHGKDTVTFQPSRSINRLIEALKKENQHEN